ncbi:MAG: hypothetical protein AAFR16_11105, partial [Pseudomonadota bacterium]
LTAAGEPAAEDTAAAVAPKKTPRARKPKAPAKAPTRRGAAKPAARADDAAAEAVSGAADAERAGPETAAAKKPAARKPAAKKPAVEKRAAETPAAERKPAASKTAAAKKPARKAKGVAAARETVSADGDATRAGAPRSAPEAGAAPEGEEQPKPKRAPKPTPKPKRTPRARRAATASAPEVEAPAADSETPDMTTAAELEITPALADAIASCLERADDGADAQADALRAAGLLEPVRLTCASGDALDFLGVLALRFSTEDAADGATPARPFAHSLDMYLTETAGVVAHVAGVLRDAQGAEIRRGDAGAVNDLLSLTSLIARYEPARLCDDAFGRRGEDGDGDPRAGARAGLEAALSRDYAALVERVVGR